MNKENIKDVLTAILIGATISFLTVLFQGLLEVLRQYGPELVGSAVGAGKYLLKAKWSHYG